MNQQHNIHDNPLLKRNPFKTPEGYLESLEEKILSLAGIAQNEEAQEVVTSLRRGRWFGVLAGTLVGLYIRSDFRYGIWCAEIDRHP